MSRNLFVCLVLLSLVLGAAAPAHAQRFKWWKDDGVQQQLALTPEQSARLEAVFQAAQPALRAQQRALSKLEDELSQLILEARVEESEVEHFIARVEAARAELGKTRTMMIFRMRLLMSTDQHVKLQKIFEQREKDRHGKGRSDRK